MSMMLWLVVAPAVFAALCLATPWRWLRRIILAGGGAAHLGLVVCLWRHSAPINPDSYIGLDPLGMLFVTLISVLFFATAIFFAGYHRHQMVSSRIFQACMLMLLSALSLVCMSQHLGLLWVALEASSLAATPLIYFRLGPRALEATWKFLLMNSVGIALALLGVMALGVATGVSDEQKAHLALTVSNLLANAGQIDPSWLRAAFLLAMIGFGTKMGLAPLHSWKPDAYGEAPPPVAALLAGGMTLGAFLGILRFVQVANAAGEGAFASLWLTVFGLLSIAVAAVFIIGNNDYRRILAYTSVEHMGVLTLGAGLAAGGHYASMLHAMHNTLNKGILFFMAGFLWRIYRTNKAGDIRGAVHRHPMAGVLLLLGLAATCGLPPFGMFYSELGILIAAMKESQWVVAGLFMLTLTIVFIGVMTAILPMVFGKPSDEPEQSAVSEDGWWWRKPMMLTPAALLAAMALGLGTYQPPFVRNALQDAADSLTWHGLPARDAADANQAAAPQRGLEAHATMEVLP